MFVYSEEFHADMFVYRFEALGKTSICIWLIFDDDLLGHTSKELVVKCHSRNRIIQRHTDHLDSSQTVFSDSLSVTVCPYPCPSGKGPLGERRRTPRTKLQSLGGATDRDKHTHSYSHLRASSESIHITLSLVRNLEPRMNKVSLSIYLGLFKYT